MEATRITVDEAKERIDRGEPLAFIDARNPEAWSEANTKLPGALRVPAGELDEHIHEIPRDRAVITYCTCPNEGSSAGVAQKLAEKGWKNVHPLYGGFDAWQRAGYPVDPK